MTHQAQVTKQKNAQFFLTFPCLSSILLEFVQTQLKMTAIIRTMHFWSRAVSQRRLHKLKIKTKKIAHQNNKPKFSNFQKYHKTHYIINIEIFRPSIL
jgi:hypothetical protein